VVVDDYVYLLFCCAITSYLLLVHFVSIHAYSTETVAHVQFYCCLTSVALTHHLLNLVTVVTNYNTGLWYMTRLCSKHR